MRNAEFGARSFLNIFFTVAAMFMLVVPVSAAEMTGQDIAEKFDNREQPKTMTAEMTMNLIDKKDNTRSRKTKTIRIGEEKMLMWFLSPADVRGVSFLRKSYDDSDDDMWIYLPAFGKVRRIASHAKGGNFMGTDFTYEDMGERKIKDYTYNRLKDEKIDDKDYYVIEWIPKEGVDTDYSKIVSWMWKDEYQPVIEEFYDKSGEKRKVKKMEVEKKGKYWLPVSMLMEDIKNNHKTELVFEKIEVDTEVKDSVFTTSYMKRVR